MSVGNGPIDQREAEAVDVLALILAIIALLLFLTDGRLRSYTWADVPLGLAFFVAAVICQLIHVTGHTVTLN